MGCQVPPQRIKKFGKLTVMSESGKGARGYEWDCKCDCGGMANNVVGHDLRNGKKTSCGCRYGERKRTHGMSDTRPHYIWGNMKKRCDNPNSLDYPRYGGRGITYCEEWKQFESFWADMKEGYRDDLTLDRKDNNGNYCKDNCRWVSLKKQQNNRRDNRIVEYDGKSCTLSEFAETTGINYNSILTRLHAGLPFDEAIQIPEKEKITYNGVTKTIAEFAAENGMTYHQLKKRLMRGWSVERALTQPLRKW